MSEMGRKQTLTLAHFRSVRRERRPAKFRSAGLKADKIRLRAECKHWTSTSTEQVNGPLGRNWTGQS